MIDEGQDHRNLAQQLDLFHFQDEAPGMVFWHPRGFALHRLLEERVRQHVRAQGYAEVRTPQLLRRPVWESSGHWQHFAGGMYRVADGTAEAAIKPVSCPGHVMLVGRRAPSYRELPLRLAELGVVHRDEPSGTLHGLLRLRQFTQDDGHVFCTEAQAEDELVRFCRAVRGFYRAFGFADLSVSLATRPAQRAGDDHVWDASEAALAAALRRLGEPHDVQPGAGAFYGPKIEYALRDRQGRQWQCATIQFDLVMPRRFDLRYVDANGDRQHPVMLHRALYGSLERFLGILLEHHGAALPAWLAPTQVVVLPVTADDDDAALGVHAALVDAGLRAALEKEDSLSRRLARAHGLAVPYQLIVGARERREGTIVLRGRGEQRTLAVADADAILLRLCAPAAEGPA